MSVTTPSPLSHALATFSVGTAVPHTLIDQARGVARATLQRATVSGRAAVDAAVATIAPAPAGASTARLWTDGSAAAVADAAYVNATAAADDDGSRRVDAAPIVAASIAVAEARELTVDQTLAAIAVGAELGARLASVAELDDADTPWSATGVAAMFGATAAVGRLVQLPSEQLVAALAIATTQACGPRAGLAGDAGALLAGHSARVAVRAALLAAEGMTAPGSPVEGRRGLLALMSGAAADTASAVLLSELGTEWRAPSPPSIAAVTGPLGHGGFAAAVVAEPDDADARADEASR